MPEREKPSPSPPPFLTISFAAVGVEGGCPAERDNEGCFFLGETLSFSAQPACKQQQGIL